MDASGEIEQKGKTAKEKKSRDSEVKTVDQVKGLEKGVLKCRTLNSEPSTLNAGKPSSV